MPNLFSPGFVGLVLFFAVFDFLIFLEFLALSRGERRASDSSREQVTEWLATVRSGVYMGAGLTDSIIRFGFLVEWGGRAFFWSYPTAPPARYAVAAGLTAEEVWKGLGFGV